MRRSAKGVKSSICISASVAIGEKTSPPLKRLTMSGGFGESSSGTVLFYATAWERIEAARELENDPPHRTAATAVAAEKLLEAGTGKPAQSGKSGGRRGFRTHGHRRVKPVLYH